MLNGKLYGVTSVGGTGATTFYGGMMFEWDLDENNPSPYREFYSFVNLGSANGNGPTGKLTSIGSKLYGVIGNTGFGRSVIFEADTDPLNPNPVREVATLDANTFGYATAGNSLFSLNGLLYGMTSSGGANDGGTIFSCDPDISNPTPLNKLYNFDDINGKSSRTSLMHYNGKLYGMTLFGGANNKGVLFSFDLDPASTTPFTKLTDFDESTTGTWPNGTLYESRGILFGSTSYGGPRYAGAIFQYDTDPSNPAPFKVKMDFTDFAPFATGTGIAGTLTLIEGKFYALTYGGGRGSGAGNGGISGGVGTIIEWDTLTTRNTNKIDFNYGQEGSSPLGSLTQIGGKLYGTTASGGVSTYGLSQGYGSLFELDTLTGVCTKKANFGDFASGDFLTQPIGNLAYYNGKLYGATGFSIYEFDPATSAITNKINYRNSIGAASGVRNGIFSMYKGKFYLLSDNGGANGQGTLFEWDPSTNALAKKIDFESNATGSLPVGGLTSYNGKFYGTTIYGGTNGSGVLFEWDPETNILVKKNETFGSNGNSYPMGTLVVLGNKLFGMTGTSLYEWDPTNNAITNKATFNTANFASVIASEGKLYCTTMSQQGGLYIGSIFEYDPAAGTTINLVNFDGANGSEPTGNLVALSSEPRIWYQDTDNDGYSSGNSITQYEWAAGYKLANELYAITVDCNDTDPTIYPGAPELCDAKDNNCDGVVDEGCSTGPRTWYQDKDRDNYGNAAVTKVSVLKPAGYADRAGDCRDTDPIVYPGAPELCDGKDNDCNGLKDDGAPGTRTWYRDADGDGRGNALSFKVACSQPAGFVTNTDDCNDRDNTIYPGAPEMCDGKDNDCNGLTDDGLPGTKVWYQDADGDGFGGTRRTKTSCPQPVGYAVTNTDCKDNDAMVYPGAPELCDGKDNDCNGLKDDGAPGTRTWYRDADGDGRGNAASTKVACAQPRGFADNPDDCNDRDNTIYLGAPELCDGKDNNCNGVKDEACGPIVMGTATTSDLSTKTIEEPEALAPQIRLWPNPASTELIVTFDSYTPNKKVEMALMTSEGRSLKAESLVPTVKGQQVRFDLRSYAAGVYLLHFKQGILTETKKVMIVR